MDVAGRATKEASRKSVLPDFTLTAFSHSQGQNQNILSEQKISGLVTKAYMPISENRNGDGRWPVPVPFHRGGTMPITSRMG